MFKCVYRCYADILEVSLKLATFSNFLLCLGIFVIHLDKCLHAHPECGGTETK